MAMTSEQITDLILDSIPDAEIEIIDSRGDGEHYTAKIKSEHFEGLTMVQQHQMVYRAIGPESMGTQLHALSIQTSTPGEE